jgi:hypothetical protein
VKWKFENQFLGVQPRICRLILRFEIIRLSCSEEVKPDRREIIVMVVTGVEMRSTSRAGDDRTDRVKIMTTSEKVCTVAVCFAGTPETAVVSVHRLAPVTVRFAIEWKCRTLGHAGSDCSPDLSFEDIDQWLSNRFIEEQSTPGLSIAISRRKKNKRMIIEFAFGAMIDFPFVIAIGISQFRFSALQFAVFRSIGMPELAFSL